MKLKVNKEYSYFLFDLKSNDLAMSRLKRTLMGLGAPNTHMWQNMWMTRG